MLEEHIEYYDEEKTKIKCKYWTLNDRLHNTKGPAIIKYSEEGKVVCKYFYLYGQIYVRIDWLQAIKHIY